MKSPSLSVLRICLALWLCALTSSVPAAPVHGELPNQASGPIAPDRLLVKFHDWATPEMTEGLLVESGLTVQRHWNSSGVYVVSMPPGEEMTTIQRLQRDPAVQYAEPDYIYTAFRTPNDPKYSTDQWNLAQINAPTAWDISTGTSDIIIAVIDTGVDLNHPDLSSKIVAGYDFVNDDTTPQDDEGHGTHVAGIAAAVTNNATGVAGVSWGARIMPVKVLDNSGSGYVSDIAEGIRWAADHGARVINLSLGGGSSSSTLQDAVNYAYGRGVLLVAASGNEYLRGNPVSYPAAYAHVMAVGATNDVDDHARYSNTGYYVDIAAPGGDPDSSSDSNARHWIMSTLWSGGSTYGREAGTSMATPHVAGLAALVWSRHLNWLNDQIECTITSTALDRGAAGRDDIFGWGRIDARAAAALDTPPICSTSPSTCLAESPHPYSDNFNQTWTLTNPDTGATYSKVHFSRIETESNYDFVTIKDGAGNVIQRFTGTFASGVWTNSVSGRTVQIQLTSDYSNTAWGFCADQIQTAAAPAWQIRTPMTQARDRLAAASVNGKVYAIGGESSTAAVMAKGQGAPDLQTDLAAPQGWPGVVEEYNPSSNTWATKATMPVPVSNIGAGVINNKIYIPGGYNGSVGVTNLQIYDPAANTWTSGASLPAARSGAAVAVLDGKLYAIGGYVNPTFYNTVYRYDPTTNAWTTRASLNTARAWAGAGVIGGKLYVAGGINDSGDLNSIEEYDPATDRWTVKTPMGARRGGPGVIGVGSYLYVVGGGWSSYLTTGERYNPATNTWETIDPMNVAHRTLGLAEQGGYLYAIGGYNGSFLNVNERYNTGSSGGPPDIDVTPTSLSATLSPGQTANQTLTIRNTGQSSLTFQISEQNATSALHNQAMSGGQATSVVQVATGGEVDAAGTLVNPVRQEPEPVEPDRVDVLPLRILFYGIDGSIGASRTEQQRLINLGATVTTVTDPNQLTEAYLNQFDVLFITYSAEANHGSLTGRAAAIQSFVAGGHGLVLEQPSVTGYQCGFCPSGFGVTVANTYWPGYPSNDALAFTSAGQTHPMFAGLSANDLSGNFDTVNDTALGSNYTRLARLANYSTIIAVAVGQYGNGRIVFETGNLCLDSSDPGSDAFVVQMLQWVAAGGGSDVPWLSETPTTGSVSAGGSQTVNVTFNATGLSNGTYRANLIIASNDPDEAQVTIPVTLIVGGTPPDIDVTPASLSATVDIGGTAQQALTVRNTGQGTLNFQVGEAPRTAAQGLIPLAGRATIVSEAKQNQAVEPGSGPAGGGPDPFGYVYKSSGEAGGPTYNWIELAPAAGGNGTEITALTNTDDSHFWPLPLPFTFNFYGASYTNLAVGTNGVLYFEDNYLGLGNTQIPGPNSYGVNRFIAHLWDDMVINPGAIYYRAEPSRLIVEYYRVSGCCTSPDSATWQVILYSNGNILYQYQDVTFGSGRDRGAEATIGIQGDTSTALQYSYNSPSLSSSQAICFAYPGQSPNCSSTTVDIPWLSESPTTGTVAAGGSTTVNVTFNAAGLAAGTYLANVTIASNDPDEPLVTIPVTLIVRTAPGGVSISVDPARRTAGVGEIFTLDLKIASGAQLVDSADAYVSFDRARLRVVDSAGNETNSIIAGSALGLVLQNSADNATGRITYSAGRQFGGTAPSGTFTLATIRFRAVAETSSGGTPVGFLTGTDVYYQGNSILQSRNDGVVVIQSGGLVGRVTLQGRGNPPSSRWQGYPLRVMVYQPGGATPISTIQVTLDSSGIFTGTGIAAGTYDIAVKNPHTLSNRKANVTVPSASPVVLGTLLEGDANDNDRVAGEDFSILATAYGTSSGQPGWDARADFNGDNSITGADFSLLATSYGRQGPIAVTALTADGIAPLDERRVNIGIQPVSSNAMPGTIFTVNIAIQAGTLAVDSVDALVVFDRAYLRVVDAAGNEVSSITAGTALPLVLQNSVDNSKGQITFSAGRQFSSPGPSGDFTLANIRFKAIAPTGGQGTVVSIGAGTDIYSQGNSVLGNRSSGVVVVGGTAEHSLYVPMIVR